MARHSSVDDRTPARLTAELMCPSDHMLRARYFGAVRAAESGAGCNAGCLACIGPPCTRPRAIGRATCAPVCASWMWTAYPTFCCRLAGSADPRGTDRGRVLADQDKHEEAITCFEEAIAMLSISSRESLCNSPDTQACTLRCVLCSHVFVWVGACELYVRGGALSRFSCHTLHPTDSVYSVEIGRGLELDSIDTCRSPLSRW